MKFSFFRFFAVLGSCGVVRAQHFPTVDDAYNPGESRGYFDIVTKPFPIPAEETTYVDFFFNIPEDAPEVFHVTYGEVINTQPEHLHHFVLTGCPNPIDDAIDGVASEFDIMASECLFTVGRWAPGADVFGNIDLDSGILLGRGMGIEALQLNVHYTDGISVNDTLKIATDGLRIHYTTDFRPYSSVYKDLINVASAPTSLTIPPNDPRFYLSRTCEVQSNCRDTKAENIAMMADFLGMGDVAGDGPITCAALQPFCGMGQGYILRMCPETCGMCGPGPDGGVNRFDSGAYRVVAVNYHAHLLGREMYTTLTRAGEEDDGGETDVVVDDLQSREFWIFDNQEAFPLDFNVVENQGEQEERLLRGTEIRPGDRIQTTCVYDSTYRTSPTIFHLSTYDEMCLNSFLITFETPKSLLEPPTPDDEEEGESDTPLLDLIMELHLLSFGCSDDEGGDVYHGSLTADEDGRDIWRDHPADKSEGCRYVTSTLFFDAITGEVRNCGEEGCDCSVPLLCPEGVAIQEEAEGGASCTGGTLDGSDSNDGTTREECESGGGVYAPYTCGDVIAIMENFGGLDVTIQTYLIEEWWRPNCCGDAEVTTTMTASICPDGVALLEDVEAGISCTGGALDLKDSNDGTTREECESGGGVYEPYTCGEALFFLENEPVDPAIATLLIDEWWNPICCGDHGHDGDDHGEEAEKESSSDAAPGVPSRVSIPAAVALVAIAMAF